LDSRYYKISDVDSTRTAQTATNFVALPGVKYKTGDIEVSGGKFNASKSSTIKRTLKKNSHINDEKL
jgi:hypothetical protein